MYRNHSVPAEAPQPWAAAASMYRSTSGGEWPGSASSIPCGQEHPPPGQVGTERCIEAHEGLAPGCGPLEEVKHPAKEVLPGRTTLQACLSLPTRDRSTPMRQNFLLCHSPSSTRNCSSFSGGSHVHIDFVSSTIPNNTRRVVGSSSFSIATGTQRLANTSRSRCPLHTDQR